jgi:5-methylcytosine-specific restriction endonuclease McrA
MSKHRSTEAKEHRKLYKRAHWKRLRLTILAGEPLCRMCADQGRITPATVVDHITPHKGDYALFSDPDNLRPLCKPCHDSAAQSEQVRGYDKAVGEDGWPTDPAHPFNRGSI